MNKKGVSFLLVFYFMILVFLVILLLSSSMQITEDTPRLGEVPSKIFDAYGQKHAIETYADHAARIAVENAAREHVGEEFREQARLEYVRLLRDYPTRPITASINEEYRLGTMTFTSSEDVRIPIQYGQELPRRGVSGAGVLTHWPVSVEKNPYQVLSVFGKRELGPDVKGSRVHPGIDLPIENDVPVLAVATGEVVAVDQARKKLFLQTENGYTCGYLHVRPTRAVGDIVEAGEEVARITKDKRLGYHLDLRCYDHEAPIQEEQAIEWFGKDHVKLYDQDSDPEGSVYVIFDNGAQGRAAYVDAYCLFSAQHKQAILQYYQEHPDYIPTTGPVTGLQGDRREGTNIEEKLEDTCRAYEEENIIIPQIAPSLELFVQSMIDEIIISEGSTLVREPDRPDGTPEWSKYGITNRAYDEYRKDGRKSTQADIANIDEEQARKIYREDYIYGPRYDELPIELAMGVIDAGVNQGPTWTRNALRELLVEEGFLDSADAPMDDVITASYEAVASTDIAGKWADKRIENYRAVYENKRPGTYSEQVLQVWIARADKYRDPSQVSQIAGVSTLRGTGSYQFKLVSEYEVPAEIKESLDRREAIQRRLSGKSIQNTQEIQEIIINSEYQEKTPFSEVVIDTVGQCQQQMQDGCSCYLKLPDEEMKMNAYEINTSENIATQWILTDNDLEYTYALYVRTESTQESEQQAVDAQLPMISYIPQTPAVSYQDPLVFGLQSPGIFVRAQEDSEEISVTVSATHTTDICEQTVMQRYEHIDTGESFTVRHPVRI